MCVCASVGESMEARKLVKDKWGGDFKGRVIEHKCIKRMENNETGRAKWVGNGRIGQRKKYY